MLILLCENNTSENEELRSLIKHFNTTMCVACPKIDPKDALVVYDKLRPALHGFFTPQIANTRFVI